MNENLPSHPWPVLTESLSGVGGIIKVRPEDFYVEEQPLYAPSGSGTHIYALIEKVGLPTLGAIALIARQLGCRPRDIGYAGLKDTQAVTRQWISVEHTDPDRVLRVEQPGLRVLEVTRHGNKLRIGHLAGNRFRIRVRNLKVPSAEAQVRTTAVLSVISQRGVPNYFGPQRFGRRANNHLLGEAVLLDQRDAFIDRFLGSPGPMDPPDIAQARAHYDAGDYERAAALWPTSERDERRVLQAFLRTGGNKSKAFRTVDRRNMRFFVSAYQSALFNRVLAQRLPQFDQILLGDMAMKHTNGACFQVTDPAAEQPRCQTFEISPTGPLFGPRMTALTGPAGDIENPILDPARHVLTQNPRIAGELGHGARRALRFLPRDVTVETDRDEHGDYLHLSFELDPGCYATTFLEEIIK